jgi:hypothetical protein
MPPLNNHVRRKGSFAPLSAHYYLDDALAQAGEAAELLYVRGLAFCAATLSDGFISDAQLPRGPGVGMRDAEKRAKKLVEVGAWVREDGGFRVRTWLTWNRSKQEILEAAETDRERKARGGSSKPPPSPPGNGHRPPLEADRIPNGNPPESDVGPNGFQPASGSTRVRLSTSTDTSSSNSTDSSGDVESEPVTWVAAATENPPPPDGARRRATRIPENFSVDADMVTWARKNAPHVDGRIETEQFRDYWQAKSGKDATKLDWPATWRTWMRRAEQNAGRRTPGQSGSSRTDEWQSLKRTGTDHYPPLQALPGGESC